MKQPTHWTFWSFWRFSLTTVLLCVTIATVAHAADLSGTWSTQASRLTRGAERSFTPFAGRGFEMTVAQSDEIQVTEERRAGNQRQTRSYVLIPGSEQELNRHGHGETVTVRWDQELLVIEAAGKWRETWEVDGDTLRIYRQSLVHSQRQRTLVLSRQ